MTVPQPEAQTVRVSTEPGLDVVKEPSPSVEEQMSSASTMLRVNSAEGDSVRTVTQGPLLDSGPRIADSELPEQSLPDPGLRTSDSGLSDPSARRAHVPFRRTLYIQEQGSVLARDDERLVVKKEGEILLEVPAAKIDQIFVFGNCTITTPAMTYCLKEEIPIVLFSSRGSYYGIIDSPLSDNISLHQQQFVRASDPEFCLTTAKVIVGAKLHNCRLLLQRHQRRKQLPVVATAIDRLSEINVRLAHATTVEEVNGYEGAGAAQYFAALGQLVDPAF